MFSHVRGSDQVHEGGGGGVGVVVRQRLQKLKCLVDEIPSELFHISLSSQQIHRKIRYLRLTAAGKSLTQPETVISQTQKYVSYLKVDELDQF